MLQELKEVFGRSRSQPVEALIAEINPKLRGWVNYFRTRLSLSHIAEGEWRAVFMGENVLLAPKGFGVAKTPWRAVQRAAWSRAESADFS